MGLRLVRCLVFFFLSVVHLSLSCIDGGARESSIWYVFQRWHLDFFCRFLTSLASGGVMNRHVSMWEMGVCGFVADNLKAGERGPNVGIGAALWPPPINVWM